MKHRRSTKTKTPTSLSLCLNVYGQRSPNDPLFILGSKRGLTRLRDALNKAIKADKPGHVAAAATVSDGTNFDIVIANTDKLCSNIDLADLAKPYHDTFEREERQEAKWPWDIIVDGIKIPKTVC